MSKFDWKATLGTVAPGLATVLLGPMAGMAAKIAVEKLGLTDEGEGSNTEKLANAVASGDPDVFVRLREAEIELEKELRRMDLSFEQLKVKREEIAAGDRDSARDLAKARGMTPQVILGAIYTGGFVILLFALFDGQVALDPEHEALANILLGMLAAGQTQVLNFFFGSSTGSKNKDAAMALATMRRGPDGAAVPAARGAT